MPAIGDSIQPQLPTVGGLVVGSVIRCALLDEKKGKYRRVTHVQHRSGLTRFRTVDQSPASVSNDADLHDVLRARDKADAGGEWWELSPNLVLV